MFYNTAAYKKAGLDPQKPARTWSTLQGELLKLRDVADIDCPYASSDQVAVHLENLAPVNGQLFTSNNNGLDAVTKKTPAPTMQFDTLYMRHISLMVSWKRSLLFMAHGRQRRRQIVRQGRVRGADVQFRFVRSVPGDQVAVLRRRAAAVPRPGHQQWRPALRQRLGPVGDGRPSEGPGKATAQFLAWLSKPVVAAEWHQRTGYLPLTEAAFRASDVSFYKSIPGAQAVIASMSARPSASSRGFRMANYTRIEPVLNQQLTDAFEGKTPPMAALNNAANQARTIATQR